VVSIHPIYLKIQVRFEVFMETKIHVAVCWIVVPCSDAVGCQRFRELCYLHLESEVTLP